MFIMLFVFNNTFSESYSLYSEHPSGPQASHHLNLATSLEGLQVQNKWMHTRSAN